MTITISGAGSMGSALTQLLTAAGHSIRITARNLSRAEAVAAANPRTLAVSPEDAVADSSVVIVATGYADAIPAFSLWVHWSARSSSTSPILCRRIS